MESKSSAVANIPIPPKLNRPHVIPNFEIKNQTTNKESLIDPHQEIKQKARAINGKNKVYKNPGVIIEKKIATMTTKCLYCLHEIDSVIINDHIGSHPSKILEWLYLGSYNNATNKKELEYANIKCILNCAEECKNLFENDFTYKHIPMPDVPEFNIIDCLEEGIQFLEDGRINNLNVFVHCQMGRSRSASVVIAYLMKMQKFTMEDAYEYVKNVRKMTLPNIGFMKQLRDFEKMLEESRVCKEEKGESR